MVQPACTRAPNRAAAARRTQPVQISKNTNRLKQVGREEGPASPISWNWTAVVASARASAKEAKTMHQCTDEDGQHQHQRRKAGPAPARCRRARRPLPGRYTPSVPESRRQTIQAMNRATHRPAPAAGQQVEPELEALLLFAQQQHQGDSVSSGSTMGASEGGHQPRDGAVDPLHPAPWHFRRSTRVAAVDVVGARHAAQGPARQEQRRHGEADDDGGEHQGLRQWVGVPPPVRRSPAQACRRPGQAGPCRR